MTRTSDSEIQQLKEFIKDGFNQLDKKIDNQFNQLDKKIDNKFNELKLELKEGRNCVKERSLQERSHYGWSEADMDPIGNVVVGGIYHKF